MVNPCVHRFGIMGAVDSVLAALDEEFSVAGELLRADARDGTVPGINYPNEMAAIIRMIDHLDDSSAEVLTMSTMDLLVYNVCLAETFNSWFTTALEAGLITPVSDRDQRFTADEYRDLQLQSAAPRWTVINRLVGPVPCVTVVNGVPGLWVPDMQEWVPYLRRLAVTS